jgi:hypothetical protein
MIITGVQHGNERGKSILRQRNIWYFGNNISI